MAVAYAFGVLTGAVIVMGLVILLVLEHAYEAAEAEKRNEWTPTGNW